MSLVFKRNLKIGDFEDGNLGLIESCWEGVIFIGIVWWLRYLVLKYLLFDELYYYLYYFMFEFNFILYMMKDIFCFFIWIIW